MKYSHNYSKLDSIYYTTIRRYPKGKVGDVVLETYPKGQHYAEILSIERETLDMTAPQVLYADTDKSNRIDVYNLFQSFYKKTIDFVKERFYIYRMKKVIGDICGMCNVGVMYHFKLYAFRCCNCNFSYQIDPAGTFPKITILNRGKKI